MIASLPVTLPTRCPTRGAVPLFFVAFAGRVRIMATKIAHTKAELKKKAGSVTQSTPASFSDIDARIFEKAAMSKVLKQSRLLEKVCASLRNVKRREVLWSLLEAEQAAGGAVSFTTLLKTLNGWESNALSYHLKPLCSAGLVERVTDLAPQDDPNETSAFRARYRTSVLLARILDPYKQRIT